MDTIKIANGAKGFLQVTSRNQLLKGDKIEIDLGNGESTQIFSQSLTIKKVEEYMEEEDGVEIDNITLYRDNKTILFIKPWDVWHKVL